MHKKEVIISGNKIKDATKALIMLHGRGATAEDIMGLAGHLTVQDFSLVAPQATNHSWYPYSFLAPPDQNEPWLSSALTVLDAVVSDLNKEGITSDRVYFLGFSQGACLTLEFVARNAGKWGGAIAFTGGLIGDKIYPENYKGDFQGTPIFIGTSDPDPHVPVNRVLSSAKILRSMNANVTEKVYPGMGHSISADELALANTLVLGKD